MKKILVFLLVFSMLFGLCACAFAEEESAGIPCMVTGNHVNERTGPSKRYESVCQHNRGEIVYVAEADGNWWLLTNGHYMYAKYLEPMCSNDVDPEVEEVEDPNDWLVTDEDEEEESGNFPRLLNFVAARPGSTIEEVVAFTHSCVIMSTRDQCIECYQDDKLICRIQLVLSVPYAKFAVTAGDTAVYEVRYIRDVVDLVKQYSTDYTPFVVID